MLAGAAALAEGFAAADAAAAGADAAGLAEAEAEAGVAGFAAKLDGAAPAGDEAGAASPPQPVRMRNDNSGHATARASPALVTDGYLQWLVAWA